MATKLKHIVNTEPRDPTVGPIALTFEYQLLSLLLPILRTTICIYAQCQSLRRPTYDHQINCANSANAKDGVCSLLILDPTFSRPEVGDPVS